MIKLKHEIIKEKILEEMLKIIPYSGWRRRSLEQASQNAGFNKNLGEVVFNNGLDGVIEYFSRTHDNLMLKKIKTLDIAKMKVRERIIAAVKIRLELYSNYKDVISQTVAYLSMPFKYHLGMKLLWKTADIIWYEAGLDKSHDFNYYTKRALLASVYSSTLIYWLGDTSENYQDTIGFLERRIDNVITMGKFLNPKKK